MAEYQNIFTRLQVRGPVYAGTALPTPASKRSGEPFFNHLFGILGDAQVGPLYLGTTDWLPWSAASSPSRSSA